MENLFAVANYFIKKGKETNIAVSQMKLQKLVYLSQGWNLAINGDQLFEDKIQAWKFGPVIPNLYQETKQYGVEPIKNLIGILDVDYNNEGTVELIKIVHPEIQNDDYKPLLDKVWDTYSKYSAGHLSDLTHIPSGPWATTIRRNGSFEHGIIIDTEVIKEHFISLANK